MCVFQRWRVESLRHKLRGLLPSHTSAPRVHAWVPNQLMPECWISSRLHARLIHAWAPSWFMHEKPIASRLHAQLINAWVPNWVTHECPINVREKNSGSTAAASPETEARCKWKPLLLKAPWTNEAMLKSSPLVQIEKKRNPALVLHLGVLSTASTWILF